jgi:hypothetical protein
MPLRRALLALLLAASAAPWTPPAAAKDEPQRPEHVVLVILGGGVRAKEMLDKAIMPTVAEAGVQGVVLEGVTATAPNPYAGAARILTGRDDDPPAGTRPRPSFPTLLECVRKDRALPAEKVWFVSYRGQDDLHLAHSEHADYGPAFAPGVAWGSGAFAQPLASFLETLGRPLPVPETVWPLLRKLRLANREAAGAWLPRDVDAGLPEAERLERALMTELDRKASLIRGPNPDDERAIRAALTVLAVHRPVLTVIRLGMAEEAQAKMDRYLAVLRAADEGIGRLRSAVAADPVTKGKTTFVVVADMGRNAAPNARGGLDADDASADRTRVALVADGPGIRRGGRMKGERTLQDVAPTVARLLGAAMPHAEGQALTALLAVE